MIKHITKIVPKLSGVKGLAVHTVREEDNFVNDHKSTLRKPVNSRFNKVWNQLKTHIILVARLGEDVEEHDIEIKALQVLTDDGGYVITAEVGMFKDTSSKVTISTDTITEGNYNNYAKLVSDAAAITNETLEYINNKTQVEHRQFLIDYVTEENGRGKKTEISVEDVEGMSEQEQIEFSIKILEKNGGYVMMPTAEEVEAPGETKGVVRTMKAETKEEETEDKMPFEIAK